MVRKACLFLLALAACRPWRTRPVGSLDHDAALEPGSRSRGHLRTAEHVRSLKPRGRLPARVGVEPIGLGPDRMSVALEKTRGETQVLTDNLPDRRSSGPKR